MPPLFWLVLVLAPQHLRPWLRGAAEPGSLPLSALQNKVSQPRSVPKTKMLLVSCTFPAQGWPHYSTSAMEQAGWEELVEMLQGRAKAWSRTVPQKAMYTAWAPSLVSCCGVMVSCAVMVRISFLGSSRFRRQFIQGSNPIWRHWITRYNAWLKKSLLGD